MLVDGGANLIQGVHTWNDATLRGGHGIIALSKSTRLDACYLDYNALVLQDPKHVSVTNSFFLGMGTIVLRASPSGGIVDGLSLLANTWSNYNMPHNDTIVLDERTKQFSSVKDLVMLGNFADENKFTARAVRVTKTLMLKNAKRWDFDFRDAFIFPSLAIQSVEYSISIEGSAFARHTARAAVGQMVAVETDEAVNATVTLTASQAQYSAGNGASRSTILI